MATLEYLDDGGSVTSFHLVPWKVLHEWLSELNDNPHVTGLAKGVNRGKVLEELEARRNGRESPLVKIPLGLLGRDRGYGKDWREYENAQGFTHLEELLIYQPQDWRKQAREYLFRFQCNLARESNSENRRISKTLGRTNVQILLKTPILVVLFHPELKRTSRYEPLNFLLAYGVCDPLPAIMDSMETGQQRQLKEESSPLDYFIEFQKYVASYRLDGLRRIGKQSKFPWLCLIKELDFCDIIGQRLAKQLIRQEILKHICNRTGKDAMCSNRHPSKSMIFAGPSGNGKTDLAHCLAKLMNKPGDDHFIKVDCGKLSDAREIFGMSGAYQGAKQGSALNNFVLRMSQLPDALGIVLLDEIEKADREVIHGLYQVIDKGEWTDKRLTRDKASQTATITCHNLVFVMTTNAADFEILDFVKQKRDIYTTTGEKFEELGSDLIILANSNPFTEAFIGRVGRIVPFLPMANGIADDQHPLLGEMMTVAKLLIERQQDKFLVSAAARVHQSVTPKTKDNMAKIVLQGSIQEAGVRSIQQAVENKMGDRLMDSLLLEQGGIQEGSNVQYYAKEEERKIDFRVEDISDQTVNSREASDEVGEDDDDLYG